MPRRPLAFLLLAGAALLAPAPPARAEQVTETYPDGKVKARWAEDDQGRRSGGYAEYYPNGKVKSRALYRRDLRHGLYTSFHENGKPHVNANYRAGKLHGKYRERDPQGRDVVLATYVEGAIDGKYEAFAAGEPISTSLWESGRVITVDGLEPYTKSKGEIRDAVEEIFNTRDPLEDDESDPEAEARGECLRLLKIYRYLVDVPWRDCALDAELNRYADAASALCERIGRLDHTPANPGMPEDEYQYAYKGTSSSNLFMGGEMERSVRGYMDDSDARNIDRVGHRRWCTYPPLRKTGFGSSGKFAAMWAQDRSRKSVPDYDFVAYPPPGLMPSYYFGERYAWSLSLNPKKFGKPDPGAVKVKVFRIGEDFVRRDPPLELDHYKFSRDSIGLRDCLIFRPKTVDIESGSRYWVEITGLERERKPTTIRYVVEFFEL